MSKELEVFSEFIAGKGLKRSAKRNLVVDLFVKTEKHLTAEELYRMAQKKNPSIGQTTVYRTLKLMCECGLCRELKFNDGLTRYEHKYGHEHHDHLICRSCGKFVEAVDNRIEELQKQLAQKYGFTQEYHRMEIYGLCKKCGDK